MFQEIRLNCGRTNDSDPLVLEGEPGVTIFVGPNNSGKSVLLQELFRAISAKPSTGNSALASCTALPFEESMLADRTEFEGKSDSEDVKIGANSHKRQDWLGFFNDVSSWNSHWGRVFRQPFCIWMGGTTRLSMLPLEQNPSLSNPTTPLARLLTDDEQRQEFQKTVYDGINFYPFIDTTTTYGHLNLAFSQEMPDTAVERGTREELVKYVGRSTGRESVSDGFSAYVGMIGALFASRHKCIMIDEPEAFLHPALARTLGKQLSNHAKDKQVFIATHSADFLMGAIESGTPVRIVRLQYQNNVASACLLPGEELNSFMQDPLLRSANTLSGLFAKSVIVGEADTDRAFYQEINTRLLSANDIRGIENAVFLNAQNKQTVPKIVKLLRKMGVPTVGVVDLDVVEEGGAIWTGQLSAAGIPESMHSSLQDQRRKVREHLKTSSADKDQKAYKTKGGVNILDSQKKEAAEAFIESLDKYGLFVVPEGEVEAWLKQLEASTSKRNWLHEIFAKLGSDSTSPDYVQPSNGDVWDFLGKINAWLRAADKRGMNVS